MATDSISVHLPFHSSLVPGRQCVIYDTKKHTLDTYDVVLGLLTNEPSPIEYTTILRLGSSHQSVTPSPSLEKRERERESETQSSSLEELEAPELKDSERTEEKKLKPRTKGAPKKKRGQAQKYTHLLIESVGAHVKRIVLCKKDRQKHRGQVLFDSASATVCLASPLLKTHCFPTQGQVSSILCLLQETTPEKLKQFETPRIELVVKEQSATLVLHNPSRLVCETQAAQHALSNLAEVATMLGAKRREFGIQRIRIAKGGAGLYLSQSTV